MPPVATPHGGGGGGPGGSGGRTPTRGPPRPGAESASGGGGPGGRGGRGSPCGRGGSGGQDGTLTSSATHVLKPGGSSGNVAEISGAAPAGILAEVSSTLASEAKPSNMESIGDGPAEKEVCGAGRDSAGPSGSCCLGAKSVGAGLSIAESAVADRTDSETASAEDMATVGAAADSVTAGCSGPEQTIADTTELNEVSAVMPVAAEETDAEASGKLSGATSTSIDSNTCPVVVEVGCPDCDATSPDSPVAIDTVAALGAVGACELTDDGICGPETSGAESLFVDSTGIKPEGKELAATKSTGAESGAGGGGGPAAAGGPEA